MLCTCKLFYNAKIYKMMLKQHVGRQTGLKQIFFGRLVIENENIFLMHQAYKNFHQKFDVCVDLNVGIDMTASCLEEIDSNSTFHAAHHTKKYYAQPAAKFQTQWDKKKKKPLDCYKNTTNFPICGHTQLTVQSSFLYRYITFKIRTAKGQSNQRWGGGCQSILSNAKTVPILVSGLFSYFLR